MNSKTRLYEENLSSMALFFNVLLRECFRGCHLKTRGWQSVFAPLLSILSFESGFLGAGRMGSPTSTLALQRNPHKKSIPCSPSRAAFRQWLRYTAKIARKLSCMCVLSVHKTRLARNGRSSAFKGNRHHCNFHSPLILATHCELQQSLSRRVARRNMKLHFYFCAAVVAFVCIQTIHRE